MSIRIGILGVGAIGGVIGGYLARADEEVTLIDTWPANIERIKVDGLRITAIEDEFVVQPQALHLGEVSSAGPMFDLVILSVKSGDTAWATKFIEPYLSSGGFVMSAQNGINEFTIAEQIGWSRLVGCVVGIGAGMYEPGNPTRTSSVDRTAFWVGEPSGMVTPRLEAMVELMSSVGITMVTTNLWGQRWSKLGVNCMANALAALSGLTSLELRQDPTAGTIAVHLAAEVVEVATALGVRVEKISGQKPRSYIDAARQPDLMSALKENLMEQGRTLGKGRPSLAQDVMKGRKTEVEHLNGYVISKGKEVGVPTPFNESVYSLAKRLEAGEIEPSHTNLELLAT